MSIDTTAYFAYGTVIEKSERYPDKISEITYSIKGPITVLFSGNDGNLRRIVCIQSSVIETDFNPVSIAHKQLQIGSNWDKMLLETCERLGVERDGPCGWHLFFCRL